MQSARSSWRSGWGASQPGGGRPTINGPITIPATTLRRPPTPAYGSASGLADLQTLLGSIHTSAKGCGIDPHVSGSAAAGVLDISVPADAAAERVAAFVAELRAAVAAADGEMPTGSVVLVRAPAAVRELVDVWGPVPSVELMRAVKDQFDPGHRLAPGRRGGI